jgi:N-acetyl-gamma-glutamyl-phosphate reductase
MAPKVFIDGHAGTTGLRIRDWMAGRTDVELLTLGDADRKDPDARRAMMATADLSVLCLPDEAAREAGQWATEDGVRLLDASSVHRVQPGWVYGLPELCDGQRDLIRQAPLVTVPGCYASAYVLFIRPLTDQGLLGDDAGLSIHALSGYSGGGRQLIEKWESADAGLGALPYEAPYALDRIHKHIPEMSKWSGLSQSPLFVPSVGPFRTGMRVQIPIPVSLMGNGVTGKTIWEALHDRYRDERFVSVQPIREPLDAHEHSFDPQACNDTNRIELFVLPNPAGHVVLIALLDNLGKGAAGVALQNLNLMLDLPEASGLPD